MLTAYERHLTRVALAVQIKPRGPEARRRAEDAEREARLRQRAGMRERAVLDVCDSMERRA